MPHRAAYSILVLRAGDGIRTRDPNLGKVVLYQLSYSRLGYWLIRPDWLTSQCFQASFCLLLFSKGLQI